MEAFFAARDGVSLVNLTVSLGIAAGGIMLALVVRRLMVWLGTVTGRTESRFDGIIVRVTAGPIAILIGTLSVFYALRRLDSVSRYLDRWSGFETALVILVGAWMLGNFVRRLINVYLKPYVLSSETDFDERLLYLLDLTAAYVIYLIGVAAALHTLGVQITGLIASLGIIGLAVALATKTILSNFFGGMILTMDRYIQPGHRVKVGEWIGDVEAITLYKTTLRTRDNLLVSIPNDVLMNKTTVNYNLPEALTRIEMTIGVAYESDLEAVTRILLDVAEAQDSVSTRKDPEVNVVNLADSAVELEILVWQEKPTGARHTRDVIFREALSRFSEEGIEIPYPHRDVILSEREGNHNTVEPGPEF